MDAIRAKKTMARIGLAVLAVAGPVGGSFQVRHSPPDGQA
jgi:hypothetical protein